jgi:hypothetical protein
MQIQKVMMGRDVIPTIFIVESPNGFDMAILVGDRDQADNKGADCLFMFLEARIRWGKQKTLNRINQTCDCSRMKQNSRNST